MPKIMNIFPSIFSGSKETKSTEGRLETDALPVVDNGTPDGNNGNNNTNFPPSISITPTVSADLTESVVRELSDPNYNSLELVESATIPGNALVNSHSNVVAPSSSASTTNTMNVHNAQQQVVMNFSNATGLHFGSVYNFNHDMSASSSRKNSCNTEESNSTLGTGVNGAGVNRQIPRKTTTIVVMMQSRDEPNHRILDTVATHLGEGWKQVMRDLGHSEGQIEQAIIDHQMHGNIKEVIYQLLLQWLRNAEDGEATIGRLTTLLWETNHRECVQRMKLVWKALEKRKVTS